MSQNPKVPRLGDHEGQGGHPGTGGSEAMPAVPAMPQFAPGPEAVPEVIDLSSDSSPDPSIEILTVPGGGNSASTDGVQPLDLLVGTSSAAYAVRADEAAKHRYHEEQQLLTLVLPATGDYFIFSPMGHLPAKAPYCPVKFLNISYLLFFTWWPIYSR